MTSLFLVVNKKWQLDMVDLMYFVMDLCHTKRHQDVEILPLMQWATTSLKKHLLTHLMPKLT